MNSDLEVKTDEATGKKYVYVTVPHTSLSACFSAYKVLSLTSSSKVRLYLHRKGVVTMDNLIKKVKSNSLIKATMRNIGSHSSSPTPPQHLEFKGGMETFFIPNVETVL